MTAGPARPRPTARAPADAARGTGESPQHRCEESARRPWLAPAVLLLVTLATLWPVCAHEFVEWDDGINVTRNPLLNPPSLASVIRFWRGPYEQMYVPATYTVWSLLAAAAHVDTPDAEGVTLDPYLFHTANLVVHLFAAWAAYRLLLTLTGRRWPACAGALLFAIHPLQVEPVAWVTGMKDVLAGALSLLALWQYAEFARRGADDQLAPRRSRSRRAWPYALATAALIAALLAKPSAVVVPVMAIAIDRGLLRRPWRRVIASTAPWLLLAAAAAIETRFAQPAAHNIGGPLWARPLIAGDALAFYLTKLFWPAALCVHYSRSIALVLASRRFWFSWLFPAAGAAAIAILARRRAPWLAPATILFVLPLLPVLGFVPFVFEQYSVVADRYAYLALLGPAVAVAFGLQRATTATPKRPRRNVIVAASAMILAALAARAYAQTLVWRDTATLFEHVLTVNPHSAAANVIVADREFAAGHYDRAERLACESIRDEPHQVDAYMALGACLRRRGQIAEEQAQYRRAIAENRPDARPLVALAASIANAAKPDDVRALAEAEALCRRAMTMGPPRADDHRLLSVIFAKRGDLRAAAAEDDTACRLEPPTPARP